MQFCDKLLNKLFMKNLIILSLLLVIVGTSCTVDELCPTLYIEQGTISDQDEHTLNVYCNLFDHIYIILGHGILSVYHKNPSDFCDRV